MNKASMRLFLLIQFTLIALLNSALSLADPQSKSFSSWHFDSHQATATITIGQREVTRLPAYQHNPDLEQVFSRHALATIQLRNSGNTCPAEKPEPQRAKTGYLQLQLKFICENPIEKADIRITTLLREAPSHVHFAKFKWSGQNFFELLFSHRQPEHQIDLSPGKKTSNQQNIGETLLTYIVFGFEHILIGIDHIAFLLTLMLLAKRFRDIVLIVTGFTLGHSITLSLAALGLASPNNTMVEAMIGFTIALVAIENISSQNNSAKKAAYTTGIIIGLLALYSLLATNEWKSLPPALSLFGLAIFSFCYLQLGNSGDNARKLRPFITTGFGLIHGFGFASVLIEVGLPEQGILPALFGFNIGVEIGQLTIVFILASLGLLAKKLIYQLREQAIEDYLSAGLCGLGVFWFVQRAYF